MRIKVRLAETFSPYHCGFTNTPELRFRALLTDGEATVRFERVAVG